MAQEVLLDKKKRRDYDHELRRCVAFCLKSEIISEQMLENVEGSFEIIGIDFRLKIPKHA